MIRKLKADGKGIIYDCFVPLTVGGHISTMEDVKWAMGEFGADAVLVNAEAHRTEDFISEITDHLGSQSVTVGIDVRGRNGFTEQGQINTDLDPAYLAECFALDGAGQIFLQSIDRDGSLEGYDLETLKEVARAVKIPVVIGGGCGNWMHMRDAFDAGADGATTSNIYHFPENIMAAWKTAMHKAGVAVRVE